MSKIRDRNVPDVLFVSVTDACLLSNGICSLNHSLHLFINLPTRSRDSSVGVATDYGLDDRRVGVRVPVGSRIFSTSSRPALGPTQPPVQWVLGALSPGVKRQGRETDHLQLVPRSRKCGSIHPLLHTPLWRSA
jgi:hypothetical protein